jgi:hypothetical protein
MLLDDRVLFPEQMLGGLARIVISRRFPDLTVHGLVNRGVANIGLSVARCGVPFQVGVRFRIERKGLAFVTSMHRCTSKGDGFGTIVDKEKIYQDDPADRVILRTSRHAFRGFWETGLKDEWDRHKAAAARHRINEAMRVGDFTGAFTARFPDGKTTIVLPIPDLSGLLIASAA